MKATKTRLNKGDIVTVIDPDSYLCDEMGEVTYCDHPKYTVRFSNGYVCAMEYYHLVKYLNEKERRLLRNEHLLQLADLALTYSDRQWFDDICLQLNKIN